MGSTLVLNILLTRSGWENQVVICFLLASVISWNSVAWLFCPAHALAYQQPGERNVKNLSPELGGRYEKLSRVEEKL